MIGSLERFAGAVRGMDRFDAETVLGKIHIADDDIVLLSGSLADGSGTPSSDFDFYVIARQADDRFDRATFPASEHMRFYTSGSRVKESFDYLPGTLLGVGCEYWTVAEVAQMIEAHGRLYAHLAYRARKASSFAESPVDFRLLSRLSYGVPLQNAEEYRQLTAGLRPTELAFTAYRTVVGSYPDFRDLAGMWVQEDYETALVAARKLGTDTFRGLTHLFGNTNRNPKYLARFLARLPGEQSALTERFRFMNAYGPGRPDGAREEVLSWLDLIDLAFGEIRARRDSAESFPSRHDFLELLKGELHESMSWNAEISNEYCFRAREAADGLPALRELIAAMEKRDAVAHQLPLLDWAAGRAAPAGENSQPSR